LSKVKNQFSKVQGKIKKQIVEKRVLTCAKPDFDKKDFVL